jgi:hypothetical protein
MPALPNRRQEIFCLKVAQGIPPYRAYEEAGYKKQSGNPYRMTQNDTVKQRLLELCGTHEAEELASRDRIMRELASIAFTPIGDDVVKVNDKRASLMNLAELQGYLIKRTEVGTAGEFDKLSADEILRIAESEGITLVELEEGVYSPEEEGSGGE